MSIIDLLSKRKFGRDHTIEPIRSNCKGVEVPTIKPYYPDQAGKRDFFVQWFGESGSVIPESQFKFPFPLTGQVFCQMKGAPQLFSVVMFGQVSDWPETADEAKHKKILVKELGLDTWILWGVNHRPEFECLGSKDQIMINAFLIPMLELPKEISKTGISPKKFRDTSVMDREIALYNQAKSNKKIRTS